MNYKKLVKEIREKLIITQEELAALLGVSFASINRWETVQYNREKEQTYLIVLPQLTFERIL